MSHNDKESATSQKPILHSSKIRDKPHEVQEGV